MSERFNLFRSIAQQLLERGQNPLSDVATTADASSTGRSIAPHCVGDSGGGRVLTPTMARWVEGAG
tara:strand:+ start:717 stop:914 length:198 start_codon:yes stop_codon:yes gene_type:complete